MIRYYRNTILAQSADPHCKWLCWDWVEWCSVIEVTPSYRVLLFLRVRRGFCCRICINYQNIPEQRWFALGKIWMKSWLNGRENSKDKNFQSMPFHRTPKTHTLFTLLIRYRNICPDKEKIVIRLENRPSFFEYYECPLLQGSGRHIPTILDPLEYVKNVYNCVHTIIGHIR